MKKSDSSGQCSSVLPGWAIYAIYVAAGIAMLFPALYYTYPLCVDYLNHLSRVFIIYHADDPFFAKVFKFDLGVIPNIGLDLTVIALKPLKLDANTALKLFYVLGAVLLWAGILECHRAIYGRIKLSILLIVPIIYGFVIKYGFMDFAFGIGVFLFAFSWFIRKNPNPSLSIPVFNIVSGIIFFCHFGALLIMVVSLFLYRLGNKEKISRSFMLAVAESAAPVALYMFKVPTDVSGMDFVNLPQKLYAIVEQFDMGSTPTAFLLALIFFSFIALLYFRQKLTLASKWQPLVIGFVVLGALAPFRLQISYFVDYRLLWIACVFFVIALDIKLNRFWIEPAILGLVCSLLVINIGELARDTERYNEDIDEFRHAIEVIQPESFVFVSSYEGRGCFDHAEKSEEQRQSEVTQDDVDKEFYRYVPALVTLYRQSVQPYIFTNPGAEAVVYRREFEHYFSAIPTGPIDSLLAAFAATGGGIPLKWRNYQLDSGSSLPMKSILDGWNWRFSYVIHLWKGCPEASPYSGLFHEVTRGSYFTIFRTDQGPASAMQSAVSGRT